MKKLPTELSDDELLNSLEDSDEIFLPEDNITSFISFYNIKPGTDKVLSGLLYHLYRNWSKTSLTRSSFVRKMGLYFEYKGGGFLVDKPGINFSQKALESFKKPRKRNSQKLKMHFEYYINFYGLKKEGFWVEDFILHFLYDKWCYGNGGKTKLSLFNFNKFCTLYFEKRVNYSENFSWYNVNENILNFTTLEQMENIRIARKKYGKKENKKRTKNLSSNES